jgi:hypothetical protein
MNLGTRNAGIARTVGHGLVGGISTRVQGGKFGAGVLSAMVPVAAQETGAVGGVLGGLGMEADNYLGNLVGAAVIGGTASELGGGKFANGAVTGAFSYAFNDALHRNPARGVADSALNDGHLTLAEANKIWRANNDPEFSVTVEASQLAVQQTSDFGPNGTALGVVQGADWLVHGSVTLQQVDGSVGILPGRYDFEQHGSFWNHPVRNFETYGGFYVGSRAGSSVGTDYLIRYSGQPSVSH